MERQEGKQDRSERKLEKEQGGGKREGGKHEVMLPEVSYPETLRCGAIDSQIIEVAAFAWQAQVVSLASCKS
jgi:hypothetical protein